MTNEPIPVLPYASDPRGRAARWRDRIVVALKALLVIVASAIFGYVLQTPTSHAVAMVRLANPWSARNAPIDPNETQRMANHLGSFSTIQQILQQAGRAVSPIEVADFESHLHIESMPSSHLIQISFDHPSRSIALTSVDLLVSKAKHNKVGYWNVGTPSTASLPERGASGAYRGAIGGALVVLGYGIVMTTRQRRAQQNALAAR